MVHEVFVLESILFKLKNLLHALQEITIIFSFLIPLFFHFIPVRKNPHLLSFLRLHSAPPTGGCPFKMLRRRTPSES